MTSTAPGRPGPTSSRRCGCPAGAPDNPDFSIQNTIDTWLSEGAPREQLVLGIPYYGQGWTGVRRRRSLRPGHRAGAGHLRGRQRGLQDPEEPAGAGLQGGPGLARRAQWLYDGTTFWTYDDPAQILQKTAYIRSEGLGGAMVWSLDGDDENASLTRAISAGLWSPWRH